MSSPKPSPRPESTWSVHRQDDNGNRFVVRTGLTRDEAQRLVAELGLEWQWNSE